MKERCIARRSASSRTNCTDMVPCQTQMAKSANVRLFTSKSGKPAWLQACHKVARCLVCSAGLVHQDIAEAVKACIVALAIFLRGRVERKECDVASRCQLREPCSSCGIHGRCFTCMGLDSHGSGVGPLESESSHVRACPRYACHTIRVLSRIVVVHFGPDFRDKQYPASCRTKEYGIPDKSPVARVLRHEPSKIWVCLWLRPHGSGRW